jgi:hypothetical protein
MTEYNNLTNIHDRTIFTGERVQTSATASPTKSKKKSTGGRGRKSTEITTRNPTKEPRESDDGSKKASPDGEEEGVEETLNPTRPAKAVTPEAAAPVTTTVNAITKTTVNVTTAPATNFDLQHFNNT